MNRPQTIVFDVNETLSDMAPLAGRFEQVGAPGSMATGWFAATLRDGFAFAVAGASAPFAEVARAVLLGLFAGVPDLSMPAEKAADHILAGFTSLSLHPDVAPGVRALTTAGHRLVTLSNGSRSVAEGLLERAGLTESFDLLLSVEDAGVWKPHASAYHYAAERCGLAASELVMVAVHPWDVDGARRAGLQTAFLDRTGAPWPSIFPVPDHRVDVLADLADELAESRD